MPLLAELAAAAQIGDRVDAAHLEPHQPADAERRRERDVEAAVAVEQRRMAAVELDVLAVHDEHRDLGAVLAREEDLLGLVGREIGGKLGPVDLAPLAARDRHPIDRLGLSEGLEREERLVVLPTVGETVGGAERRQVDEPDLAAVRVPDLDARGRVVEVLDDEVAAHGRHRLEHGLGLRDHLLQLERRRRVGRDRDQPAARGAQGGAEVEELAAVVDEVVARVPGVEQRACARVRLGQVEHATPRSRACPRRSRSPASGRRR